MDLPKKLLPASRRRFFGKLMAGASALGVASVITPLQSKAAAIASAANINDADPDAWFLQMKGKHRMVIDSTEPKDILPFAWPKVYIMTNQATGATEKDCNVVLVLRHNAIPYALQDELWAKYKLGEAFKINDPRSGAPATRNPFWQTKDDDYKIPGIGAVQIGIADLQKSGVMFCVCDVALTVHTAVMAQKMNTDAAAVKKEWIAGVLPGIQVMPSGMWAIGRAQEHGCGYTFAG